MANGSNEIRRTSYTEFIRLAAGVNRRLDELGLTKGKHTRFSRYETVLRVALEKIPRRDLDLTDPEVRGPLQEEAEAMAQCVQMACALLLEAQHPDKVLLSAKLVKALKGKSVPLATDQDQARNTLFELTTASLLMNSGLQVSLTADREDVLACVPGGLHFPIECKRPIRGDGVENALRDARRQLGERMVNYPNGGMVAIGLDRIYGLSGDLGTMEREADLPPGVADRLQEATQNVIQLGGEKLPKVAFGILTVMAGVVFTTQPLQPYMILRVGIGAVPGPQDLQRDRIYSSLHPHFRGALGLKPSALLARLERASQSGAS